MEEKKKSRLPIIAALIFFVVLAGIYVYLYVLPDMDDTKDQSTVVRYAKVQDQAVAKCIVARSETVYSSGGPGSVSYYAEEGTKIRVGTIIADAYGSSGRQSYYAPKTGFISYYLDGYEEMFDPSAFSSLDPDEVAQLDTITPKSEKPAAADSDVPIFKFIDSDTWYVLIIVPEEERDRFAPQQNVTLQFTEEASVPAVISLIVNGEKHQLAVASVSRYYDKFLSLRSAELTVISSVTEGLVVPTGAIATNGENMGVYVLGLDSDYYFRPIEILISGENETLIADGGSVNLYDEVLTDARDYQK